MKKFLIMILTIGMITCTGCNQKVENNELSNSSEISNKQEVEQIEEKEEKQEVVDDIQVEVTEEKKEELDNTLVEVKDEKQEEVKSVSEEIKNGTTIPKENDNGITVLKFKNTNSHEAISALNGKKVSITGYLSTLSPLNGKFAYLMNMPYQNCPYCVPGTSAITNTLTIVAKENDKIEFTDQPVTVVGTLETGNFTDEFGYEYGVRLSNVTVNKANVDELGENIKKYNLLAENGVVNSIYGSIMIADTSVFYDYYEMEVPQLIQKDYINSTKAILETYNKNNDYDILVNVMNNLITLCDNVNSDINKEVYSNFPVYQHQLQNIYYSFATWMAEGEL